MATRFYLQAPNQTIAPISPAPDSGWEKTSTVRRCAMFPYKTGTTTSGGPWNVVPNGVSGTDTDGWQFISTALHAQTISGFLKGMMQCAETNSTDNYNAATVARVLSNDGSVIRGTLFSGFGGGTAFNLTTVAALKFPPAWTGSGVTLTSVTALEGDRIVLEVGVTQTSTSTANAPFRCFDNQTADLPETEGDTSVSNPWFEFSQDISIAPIEVVPFRAIPFLPQGQRSG